MVKLLLSLLSLLYLAIIIPSAKVDAFAVKTAKPTNSNNAKNKKPQVSDKDLPKFNKKTQRWEKPSTSTVSKETGYPLYETLLRNGPVPFFTRLTNSDDYEQAVLKFQAAEKCTINEAQGNMDAYFENPNDWAYQRVVEERGGYKKEYGAPLDPKQVALTVVWGGGISFYIASLVYSLGSGKWCAVNADANFCKVFFH